jgi:hypothetical protein
VEFQQREMTKAFTLFVICLSILLGTSNKEKKVCCLSLSGFQFKMHYKILHKLRKAGATSEDRAVTIGEAELDLQEQMWLDYFAGVFLGRIKKTEDHRYYIQ